MTKAKKSPKEVTPADLSLEQIMAHFNTEDAARTYLEGIRWPNGPVCPHCGNTDAGSIYAIAKNTASKIRAGLRECNACEQQFTVTVGTIFEDSKIPLQKWLVAWYMLCSSKKGVSALQMQRMLSLGSYRTAWLMMHKIRFALRSPVFADQLGTDGGTVEVDETYVGGKPRYRTLKPGKKAGDWRPHRKGPAPDFTDRKTPVVALVERGGRVRSFATRKISAKMLKGAIREHVDASARIYTDERRGYQGVGKHFDGGHHTVNHGRKEYARGDVSTNTVEGYFSILKRGVNGVFHHIGAHYMDQYLAEFDFRYNTRTATDGERTVAGLRGMSGKRLMLRRPAKRTPR